MYKKFFIFTLLLFFNLTTFARIIKPVKDSLEIQAKVIRIVDGDTMEVLYHELPIKIRMAHIDCPEKRGTQPFGNKAKKVLSAMVFGDMVTVNTDLSYDRNGRLIAEIISNKYGNINMQMVRKGMAWHYQKYSDNKLYQDLEKIARKQKVGLWQDPHAVAPWAWRNRKRK
ncbi:thermonuclease family protein [Flavobacteriaceae bacterium Ap0902]|nr:thermonuclease family protein [Flavobacteriaceae bacterium Ap0902]